MAAVTCACGEVIEIPLHTWRTAQTISGPCVVCQREVQEVGGQAATFIKAVGCAECIEADLGAVIRASDNAPCCNARVELQAFGGTIVAKAKPVPPDEIWLKIDQGVYQKYRVDKGQLKQLGVVRSSK